MNMRITATTDGQFLGKTALFEDGAIMVDTTVLMLVESMVQLDKGTRFVSSNYIIDAIEV
jgi:hypothetical protein